MKALELYQKEINARNNKLHMTNQQTTKREVVKTELIKGTPCDVVFTQDRFYEKMQKNYPTFKVISVNTIPTPYGCVMSITYSVVE